MDVSSGIRTLHVILCFLRGAISSLREQASSVPPPCLIKVPLSFRLAHSSTAFASPTIPPKVSVDRRVPLGLHEPEQVRGNSARAQVKGICLPSHRSGVSLYWRPCCR